MTGIGPGSHIGLALCGEPLLADHLWGHREPLPESRVPEPGQPLRTLRHLQLFGRDTHHRSGLGGQQMICTDCKNEHHEDCRGGSWCDCAHGRAGSTLTAQQRTDLAVDGTAQPARPQPAAASNGHVQQG